MEGFFPLLVLLACADGRTVAYRVWRQEVVKHLLQHVEGFIPLLVLPARADGRSVAHHVCG